MKRGFTLVEMLITISILTVLGTLILTIFSRTLQGGNKSKIEGIIKQNGQSVLEQMDKTVRSAGNVVCPTIPVGSTSASSDTLMVVNNGTYTRYRFIPANTSLTSPTGTCNSTNGCILQDNPVKQIDSSTGKEETDPVFVTSVCATGSFMPRNTQNPATVLTDTNPQTGVSLENYSFTRDKPGGSKDQVTIKFDLKPGVSAPTSVTGQISNVTFQTTIELR